MVSSKELYDMSKHFLLFMWDMCVHVPVCMCVPVHLSVCIHACAWVWKSEVDVLCFLLLSTRLFEIESLTETKLVDGLNGWPVNSRDLLVSASQCCGYRQNTVPSF